MGPSGRKSGEDERKWGKTAMAEQVFVLPGFFFFYQKIGAAAVYERV